MKLPSKGRCVMKNISSINTINNCVSFKNNRSKQNAEKNFASHITDTGQSIVPVVVEDSIYKNYMHAKDNSIFKSTSLTGTANNPKSNEIFNDHDNWRYTNRQQGEFVFDLSQVSNMFENKIAYPEVEVYSSDTNTVFRSYFVTPNSNELIVVKVNVPKDEYDVPMEKEQFMKSIGKAFMLIDKTISLKNSLGDVVPQEIGAGFSFDKHTNTIDLKPYYESLKKNLTLRMTGQYPAGNENINYSVNQAALESALQELEDFILKLGL